MGAKRWILLLLGAAAIVGIAMAAVSSVAASRARESFADLGDGYVGHIEDVELSYTSLELRLRGIRIERKEPRVETPFLTANALVMGVTWRDGNPMTVVRVERPLLNFVDAQGEARDMWGPPFDVEKFRADLPFDLERLVVHDAELHLRAYQAKPEVDVYAQHFDLRWDSLRGCMVRGEGACDSRFEMEALVLGASHFDASGQFSRNADFRPDTLMRGGVDWLPAQRLAAVATHYGKVDFQGGELALDFDVEQRGEQLNAIVAPRAKDVDVLGSENRRETRFFRELATSIGLSFFERRDGKKAIRFHGRGDDVDWEIVDNPLHARLED